MPLYCTRSDKKGDRAGGRDPGVDQSAGGCHPTTTQACRARTRLRRFRLRAIFHSLGAVSFRDEVIKLHGRAHESLLAQAITATIACLSTDLGSQGLGDVRAAHQAPTNSEHIMATLFQREKTAAWGADRHAAVHLAASLQQDPGFLPR